MKKLIILNIIIGLVLVVVNFYIMLSLNNLLGLTYLLFLSLIFVNFISIFMMWRKHKYLSFYPLVISLFFFSLLGLSGSIGRMIGMYNKPSDPNSFFNEERKQELTGIAEELLQAQDEKSKRVIEKKLKSHHLMVCNVDSYANIVEFGYCRLRTWSRYIFAKDELPEMYSSKPIITKSDILDWGELATIIKTENDPSKYERDAISFMPEIIYPFLLENLDKEFVDKLAGLPSIENLDDFLAKNKAMPLMKAFDKRDSEHENLVISKLSKEEKLTVIEVLNKHYQISSKLIENKNISWRPSRTLEFCGYMSLSSSFQVNKHLRQLISGGVISIIDGAGHLKVKPNLSDKEKLEIEWLQVEIMNTVYGNLVAKTEYWSNEKTKLANNWYFYKY